MWLVSLERRGGKDSGAGVRAVAQEIRSAQTDRVLGLAESQEAEFRELGVRLSPEAG